ncbi:unnamed protein product [Ilex paraguariensis]|uniref:25S rRNA (uridine-N(3))-methyltransferase BMT5-like domain-containing protein n=1 Tax=Ilex paraguariensis TaxID=185542 RepID=A0ABC8RNB0_9AQUA
MGRVLSGVIRCICGEVDDENPSESSHQVFLASQVSSNNSCPLLQPPLFSPPSIDSCSDSCPVLTLNPPFIVSIHGDSITNDAFYDQKQLDFRRCLDDSHSDPSTNGVFFQVLSSAPSSVTLSDSPGLIESLSDSSELGFLSRNYWNAMANIQNLRSRGCKVMHGVDATEMANNFLFKGEIFDRIIFNFPLAGFFPNESREAQQSRHKRLVGLFLENASEMISENGEIHIAHKSNGFFREWNLPLLASKCGLLLIEEQHFDFADYPGYRTKYGFGGNRNFHSYPSKIYKFGLWNCQKFSL